MGMSLAIAGVLYALGAALFGHFETKTPPARRLRKLVVFFGVTALLAAWVGDWALVWVLGTMGAGLGFHFAWCRLSRIHPLSAEPKEQYYRLRRWSL
ncbi:MAG: hypothetical protein C4333_10670 [Meiothermus sp.]